LNLIAGAPVWLAILLACAMAAAAVEDAARFRISNLIAAAVLIGALVAAAIAGPSLGLWQNIAVFLILLLLGTGAFAAGWLGGGDVKLFAAAGLWFDLRVALAFVVLVFLAGGLVAIAYLIARPFRGEAADKKSRRVPYGVAIAVGALAMILISRQAPSARERAFSPLTTAPHRL
jgi:prepilin peptidase CpaA